MSAIATADALMGIFGFKRVMGPVKACGTCGHAIDDKGQDQLYCTHLKHTTTHPDGCSAWKPKE